MLLKLTTLAYMAIRNLQWYLDIVDLIGMHTRQGIQIIGKYSRLAHRQAKYIAD